MYTHPKTGAIHENNGKRIMSKSKLALECAKIAGYEDNSSDFMRLRIESKVSYKRLLDAWMIGSGARPKVTA